MNFFIFISTYLLLTSSVVGYGYFFSRNLTTYNKTTSVGYLGIYGIFFLTLISYITNIFFKHDFTHNLIIFVVGIFFFVQFVLSTKNLKNDKGIKYLFFFLILSFFSILYFKSHDDFPYYHLDFINNITLNKVEFGLGNFDLAYNHVSSLFFFHSLFKLPFTSDFFYYLGPAIIVVFSNVILVENFLKIKKNKKFDFLKFLSLLIFVFINIFFYRLAEHGTDRSAIILLLLITFFLFQIIKNKVLDKIAFENFIIFLTLIVSIKSFYALYAILFFIIYFKYFSIKNVYSFYKQYRVINFSITICLLIIFYNIAYTGCLIYPVVNTCFENFFWSMDSERMKVASHWYELWAKAGATPDYRVDDPIQYIKGINWVSTWIDNYFFNKVSDNLLGLFTVILIFFFLFKPKKIIFYYPKEYNFIFIILAIYLVEWFFYHPSLRYGGYHLIALAFFIPTAILMNNQNYKFNLIYKKIYVIILLTILVFVARNINRINNEIKVYNYNPLISPRYNINSNDYTLQRKKENIFKNTNNCTIKFKKNKNCKIINSYRFFY